MSIHKYCRKALRASLVAGLMPEWLQKHPRRFYIERTVLASPSWIKQSDFAWLVKNRDDRTRRTGIKHVLDHIIPLSHPLVCGLNVPWNVRVITEYENMLKSNVWYDEPDTLLPVYEQLRLFA